MKSTAQPPGMPREVEALRTLLESRLSALERALADPKQHGSLESMISDLARVATEEADATARHAVLEVQKAAQLAVSGARSEGLAALEAERAESAALRQVLENAKSALKQAEAMLKEQRRDTDAATQAAAGARRELDALKEQLEREQSARVEARRELEAALAAVETERARASALALKASETHAQEDSEKSALAIDLEQHRAALETERAAAEKLLEARAALEGRLDEATRELESMRAQRDAAHHDLDAARREIDSMRQDAESRTEVLSQSHAAHEQALKAAQDAARDADERFQEAIRERDAAQGERAELQRQLQAAEAAIREAAEVNRELQAAHEARDAAEVVDAARHAERHAGSEPEIETVVDLTAVTEDQEWQRALEQRTRALEQSLRDAEARAEAAELELERRRRSAPPAAVSGESVPASPGVAVSEQAEQFRGPARAARRVAFKKDIQLHVDGNPGKLVDLSLSGAQVLTPSAINPNRLVTVTLPAIEGAMTCKAKVVWSRLEPRGGTLWYRAGVQFTNVDQHAVESFLAAHQP